MIEAGIELMIGIVIGLLLLLGLFYVVLLTLFGILYVFVSIIEFLSLPFRPREKKPTLSRAEAKTPAIPFNEEEWSERCRHADEVLTRWRGEDQSDRRY